MSVCNQTAYAHQHKLYTIISWRAQKCFSHFCRNELKIKIFEGQGVPPFHMFAFRINRFKEW